VIGSVVALQFRIPLRVIGLIKFLRLQRDEIVQAELRMTGQACATDVASRLQLVTLEPAGASQ
jgi:hypothetical protein